ncbi:MAG: hypothetical protein AAF802_21960 [Planctomycetota bacterium]
MTRMLVVLLLGFAVLCGNTQGAVVELVGDDHHGYLSASGFKNWETEAAAVAGLPDYAYYQVGPDLWTSIVSEPLSATSIYAEESSFEVFNKTITDPDFQTRSSGSIEYDESLITGVGVETIGIANLTVMVDGAAFSPLNSPHNAGGGFGNAGWDYVISISDVSGAGISFFDGTVQSIDLTADVSVLPRFGGSFEFDGTYDGTLQIQGDQFQFDVDVTRDVGTIFGDFTGTRLVFNRGGTIAGVSAIPEPSMALPLALALVSVVGGRRRRA